MKLINALQSARAPRKPSRSRRLSCGGGCPCSTSISRRSPHRAAHKPGAGPLLGHSVVTTSLGWTAGCGSLQTPAVVVREGWVGIARSPVPNLIRSLGFCKGSREPPAAGISHQHRHPPPPLTAPTSTDTTIPTDYTSFTVFTESQHGRGWKGPLWVTQSNPLPKQGHPQQAAQDRVQAGLEYLQRRRLHSLPGQPGPGLHHP